MDKRAELAPDLIAALVQTWTKELNSRGEVRATALEIKAAWHQGALAKLESMGVRLESYLVHRKMVVVIGGQPPQFQDMSAGVPHSSVPDPIIFSCFINDLPSIIRHRDIC